MRMVRQMVRYKAMSALFGASLLLVVGGFAWGYLALRHHPSVILHFGASSFERNRPAINQYGTVIDLFRIGFLGLLSVLLNFFIGLEVASRDRFLAMFVAVMTLCIAVLLFIGVAAIISVN